ncbi:MAG: FAD-binding oxidoreductase [Rubrivivax sp.]|nr:FAD-binding oxidoreductase [Rubrivivax sp.]
MNHPTYDIAVIGAGIAGASLAYFAAPQARVLLLEREAQPGMHSTGRSAAMFMESYGSPQVRGLTRASRPFLTAPPPGFSATPLLGARGALTIARATQAEALRATHDALCGEGCPAQWLDQQATLALLPVLRPEAAVHGSLDPLAADLDVNALHQGYLRGARAAGARLLCDAEVLQLQRQGGRWQIETAAGRFSAAQVVNAAGAWVDELSARAAIAPIGIQPRRRSAFVFDAPVGLAIGGWPCVADVDESFYFKPDAGLLLGSPANADAVLPHDVLPEDIDIATGIARIEAATTLHIRRPRRTWAGLRSFVADGDLVAGVEPAGSSDAAGFFWLAAQGGYGIQTSAAMGALCAAQLLRTAPPAWLAEPEQLWATLGLRRARF